MLPDAKPKCISTKAQGPLPSLLRLFHAEDETRCNTEEGEASVCSFLVRNGETSGLGVLTTVLVSPIITTLQKNCLGWRLCSNQTYTLHGTHVPGESMQPGEGSSPPTSLLGRYTDTQILQQEHNSWGPQPDIPNEGVSLVSQWGWMLGAIILAAKLSWKSTHGVRSPQLL